MKVVSVVDRTNHEGFEHLAKSLAFHKYEHIVLIAPFHFGGQMQHVYNWCKQQPKETRFIYSDGFDTVALWPSDVCELLLDFDEYDILFAAEKGCYPDVGLADKYPETPYEWRYVNGGNFATTCGYFAAMYEESHTNDINDQLWLSHCYLRIGKRLDTACEIFQTIAFEGIEDFKYWSSGKLLNRKTKTHPIFIHGNGRTDMTKIYELMNSQYDKAGA